MFLEVEDDSSATWAAAGDVGPGAQQQSKSQMPTGPSPTCIFLNFCWANGQHGLTPLVLLHDHALRPAAGTWARRRDSRRDRTRRPAGLREQAQPSAACGRERAAGAAGVRQRRVHDGRWLAGGATAGGCGGGLRGGVTAGGCLGTQTTACWAAGRRAASRDQRSKAQGRQAAIARTKEH